VPVTRTVLHVLQATSASLRPVEVHRQVEMRLDAPVSWSSVKNALVDLVAKPDCQVERVGYGRYRWDGPLAEPAV
jgi:hypothetical protein